MRVTTVSTSFPLRQDATSGIFVLRFIRALKKYINIQIVTPADSLEHSNFVDGYLLSTFRYAPKRLQTLAQRPGGIPIALKNKPWLWLLVPIFLMAMLISCYRTAKQTDLFHAHWAISGFIAGIAGMLSDTPVVTTLHGSDVSKKSLANCFVLYWCLRLSKRVVTVSKAMEIELGLRYPKYMQETRMISNGIEEELLQLPIGKISNHPVQLLSIGSLIPGKAVDLTIMAITQLRELPMQLTVVGSGPELNRLRSLVANYQLGNKVVFVGEVAPDRIIDYLQRADVFILSSQSEGRPSVVLEAMAAGKAIISSNIMGMNELIRNGDTGILFQTGDAGKLATALKRIINDAELHYRLCIAARAFIQNNNLTWDKTAEQYLNLYSEIIKINP